MSKRARAVIGANFGDEGKGLVTDFLCAFQGAGMVVRFNGGAQAGHTVVAPGGERHVFSHVGSGTFAGVPTFLSQFFVCNPILFLRELEELAQLGLKPVVYAHPNCLITTFADMMINQHEENARGDARHGSCGVGVNETVNRSKLPELQITLSDIWNGANLEDRLRTICGKYTEFRTGKPIADPDKLIAEFVKRCQAFAQLVHPLGIAQCPDPIFEGAQGLLLSQDNKEFFPHLTRSYTGMRNVRMLCAQAGITEIEPYYVSRTYLTRHGAGPLPGEDRAMSYEDDTNVEHAYQGKLRFAPLSYPHLFERCAADAGDQRKDAKIVLTHCDQVKPWGRAHLFIGGPKRTDTYEKAP